MPPPPEPPLVVGSAFAPIPAPPPLDSKGVPKAKTVSLPAAFVDPPPPTVIGVFPDSKVNFVPPGKLVRNPPAPPPPPAAPPPPAIIKKSKSTGGFEPPAPNPKT